MPKKEDPKKVAKKKSKPAEPEKKAKVPEAASAESKWKDCFEKYLPLARELPAEQRPLFRGNARIVQSNVRYAMTHHGLEAAKVREQFSKVTLEQFSDLEDIARALGFAVMRTQRTVVSSREIAKKISALAPLREEALQALRALARRGSVPADRVAAIEQGTGPIDLAEDAIAIVDLFTTHKKEIAGRHPLSDKELDELRSYGEWLSERLRPKGTKVDASERTPEGDDRDAIAALLRQRYQQLRAVAYFFHGDAVDEHVPPLQSASRAAVEEDQEEPPPSE